MKNDSCFFFFPFIFVNGGVAHHFPREEDGVPGSIHGEKREQEIGFMTFLLRGGVDKQQNSNHLERAVSFPEAYMLGLSEVCSSR